MTNREKLNGRIFATENYASYNGQEKEAVENKPKLLNSNLQAATAEISQLLILTSVLWLPTQSLQCQCSVNN
jgi:hypothetical protein